MAEDDAVSVGAGKASALESEKAFGSEAAEGPQESKAKGILRDAIRRVMEDIERHEDAAKRHLQQAADLRKDLRDSIAFLQKQGEKAVAAGTSHHESTEPSAKAKAKSSSGRRPARKK